MTCVGKQQTGRHHAPFYISAWTVLEPTRAYLLSVAVSKQANTYQLKLLELWVCLVTWNHDSIREYTWRFEFG